MREVIVPVGPRACGKSSFCKRAVAIDPSLVLVSRDDILIELYGGTFLSPYTGGHQHAIERMWKIVEERFKSSSRLRMILDTWNGSSGDRRYIIHKIRGFGADRIVAWYFVTPVQYVEEWFWKKPGIAKMEEIGTRQGQGLAFFSEDAPQRDYTLFHQLALGLASDGFDTIVKIDPLVIRPEQVLGFRTEAER